MNPAIYLSCLVLLIGTLVWTARADQDFEDGRKRVLEIFKDASHDSISEENVHFLVGFLDKYSDQIELTSNQRERVADALREYKEERAKQEGVRLPTRWLKKLLREALIQLGIEIGSAGVKKVTKE